MSAQSTSLTPAPTGYADWLLEPKTRTHSAQQRAVLAANRESDLARESLKDPYRFDFLGLTDEAQERNGELLKERGAP